MNNILIQCPCGCLLTPEQARTVAARLTAASRKKHSGGSPATCTCGQCPKCRKREQMRKYRAGKSERNDKRINPEA